MTRAPWYVWTAVLSVTSILVGSYWDISWHMSVGRDSFWTPPHILIQLGGIVGGVSGGVLIITTTLRQGTGIRVWGFRGPLGAFLASWGAATMVVSAPFDNWWHAAYGLDVKILSPPHAVLAAGVLGVSAGAMLLVLSTMNRATGAARARVRLLALVLGGEILSLAMIAILELTFRSNLHRASTYRGIAIVCLGLALPVTRAVGGRWAMTAIAGVYTAFMTLGVWLCPLVPATPKLGPVYQPITHLVPLPFPVLVIVPAIAVDLLLRKLEDVPRQFQELLIGTAFLAVLLAAEWPFASFLQTGAAASWVFGTAHHAYFMRPEWYEVAGGFMPDDALVKGLGTALVVAIGMTWLGLAIGDLLRKVRR